MIKINNTEISDIKINDTSVSKVMAGSTKVWEKQQLGPSSYSQNGLVFQLDGIDKGSNVGYWTDLIGGIKYDLSDADGVENNCVVFDQSPLTGDRNIPEYNSLNYQGTTLEVVVKLDNTDWNNQKISIVASIDPNDTNQDIPFTFIRTSARDYVVSGLGRWDCRLYYYNPLPNVMTIAVKRNGHGSEDSQTYSCHLNKIQQNSPDRGWDLNDVSYESGLSSIGGVPIKNELFKGKIYAVRYYHRMLTDEEILQHQEIDAQRFGLTISAADNN